jgi:DNA-binding NtrC family response regulator
MSIFPGIGHSCNGDRLPNTIAIRGPFFFGKLNKYEHVNHTPTVILASSDSARSESLLSLLRRRRCCPVLLGDLAKIAVAVEDGSAAIVALTGSHAFCQPLLQFFTELRARQPVPPLFVLATDSSEAFDISSLRAGAADYFTDPLEAAMFAQSVARWVPECTMIEECPLAGGEVLVGASPTMQALRAQIRRVAASDCNVLITGETGTGKELVAQLIHQNSSRRGHPLVAINCAAIPDSLLESELFGYERGAFTGAALTNQGKLLAANRGTVFFDEIGDMSPLAQAKVLRAIETKEIQRLGANRTYETDIRIVGATHHNLDELAGTEAFRRDLYFRLNVGRIHLTPLRERKSDIAELAERMVLDLNKKQGRRVEGITSGAVRLLAQHDWPGNVRELKNVIERIFISRDRGRIDSDDVSRVLPASQARTASGVDKEMRTVQEALVTCKGNKSKAAEILNWSRMTLYRKLAKYRI